MPTNRGPRSLAGLVGLVVVLAGLVTVPVTAVSGASNESALTAKYGPNEIKSVQRNPAWPACTGTLTVSSGNLPYSDSSGGPVDLTTVVSGGAYLRLFKSGDATQPWGIAMYQNGTDLELRYKSGTWLLPSDPNYATALPFTQKGQAYGLYSGGFLHDSSPRQFGNFMLIGQSWPGSNSLTYTPDPALNDCVSSKSVAKVSAVSGPEISGFKVVSLTAPSTTVTSLTADRAVTWSIAPGADAALFQVNSSGVVSFINPSTPGSYVVTVTATDSNNVASTITISVTATAPAPTPTPSPSPTTTPSPVPTPTPSPTPTSKASQFPAKPMNLPQLINPGGSTTLVHLPLTMNSGAKASVRAKCLISQRKATLVSTGDVRPTCTIIRTSKSIAVRTSGVQSVRLRLVITAPETDAFEAFRFVKTYRVASSR